MSDIIKWALLVAGVVIILALIFALPIASGMDLGAFTEGITNIVGILGGYLKTARGFLNNLVLPTIGPPILTACIAWTFTKFFATQAIKIITWVYHFIFK